MMMKEMFKLPCPTSITYMWNYGSLLGLYLWIQILSGIFLSMHYKSSMINSFESVFHINLDVNWGWLLRYVHANGATFFFIFIYAHIARGLYYMSFNLFKVWIVGILIYLVFMGVAFLGYVLPWGQMSYWGATVITNLISALPWLGSAIVEWLWGGFSVSEPTLMRFFSVHFVLPFLGLAMVMIHLVFLHETGSNNPMGGGMNIDKVSFHPYFTIKDILGFVVAFMFFIVVCLKSPSMFMDPDNFIEANPLSTPVHIQPEWYFLFAYAILRSVPSKLGGVVAMLMSILILVFLSAVKSSKSVKINKFYEIFCINQYMIFIVLTWIGSLPVEDPYLLMGQFFAFFYFVNLFFMIIV
uniref:cytochrome b n=1 Tax=Piagetiella africana TaxID=2965260 RepID=UPI00286D5C01|nr:cytochrome b [Piagetiella africana]WKF19582.1 cytochrome b [Piagetiella africana]